MRPGARVVVVLQDSVRNYLTKFVDDGWMRRNGFATSDWEGGTIGDLLRELPARPVQVVHATDRLDDVVRLFKQGGISQAPVLDEGKLAGILTETDVLRFLVEGRAGAESSVAEVMVRQVSTVGRATPATELTAIFERGEVALVVEPDQTVAAILTRIDLIEYLARRQPARERLGA
jgi:cystathionine beta-synthase